MIITTVADYDYDWKSDYENALILKRVTTVQKLIIVRFLINLENITECQIL